MAKIQCGTSGCANAITHYHNTKKPLLLRTLRPCGLQHKGM